MSKFKVILSASAAVAALAFAHSAEATTVTIVKDDSSVFTTDALTGFATNGSEMAGMEVTGTTGSASSMGTWAATGTESGSASGTGFTLSQSGDTFNSGSWTLNVSDSVLLTGLTLNGVPGNTIFDTSQPSFGTDGSAAGLNFAPTGAFAALSGSITATYSGIVALTGSSPVTDIFAILNLDFTGLSGGGLGTGTWTFTQDTDNAIADSPLTPQVIPLPAAAWMLLAGLGGLAAMKRRKTKIA